MKIPVTREFVEKKTKDKEKYIPYTIEGIPEDLSFLLVQDTLIDHLMKKGYLIAYKIGAADCSNAPIVYDANATVEEIEEQYKWAENRIRELYAQLELV